MSNEKMNNLKSTFQNNPAARTNMVVVGAVIAVVVVIGVFMFNQSTTESAEVAAAAAVTRVGERESIPGTSVDPNFNRKVEEENRREAEEALRAGQTSLPTLVGSVQQTNLSIDPLPSATDGPIAPLPPIIPSQPVAVQQIVPIPPSPPQDLGGGSPNQSNVSAPTDRQKAMNDQMRGYLSLMSPSLGRQEREIPPAPVVSETERLAQLQESVAASRNQQQSTGGGSPPTQGTGSAASFVKAGHVIAAKLLTPISSDAPGPVLAEVVSGPLRGARVLGAATFSERQIVVQFNRITIPKSDQMFQISAVAVSLDFSPGLATEINHRYFQRVVLPAAAAFASSFGQALAQPATTIVVGPFGSTTSQENLTTEEARMAGYAALVSTAAGEISRRGQVSPTIEAKGQDGRSLPFNLLFLENF